MSSRLRRDSKVRRDEERINLRGAAPPDLRHICFHAAGVSQRKLGNTSKLASGARSTSRQIYLLCLAKERGLQKMQVENAGHEITLMRGIHSHYLSTRDGDEIKLVLTLAVDRNKK